MAMVYMSMSRTSGIIMITLVTAFVKMKVRMML